MPDSPWPVVILITVIGVAGFEIGNNVDFEKHPRWDLPQWMVFPLGVALLAVSYLVIDWIQGLQV